MGMPQEMEDQNTQVGGGESGLGKEHEFGTHIGFGKGRTSP